MIELKPYLVGISGGSGCGKTTILKSIFEQMPKDSITLISQDNYYRPIEEQPKDKEGIENFDTPDSFYRQRLINDIINLSQGKKITQDEYTFNNDEAISKQVVINPSPIILIEGLFVFHFEEINSLLNYRVFIDTKEEIRLQRRIDRDLKERGYPEKEVRYQWKNHVMPAYNNYLEPYLDSSDLIIDNSVHYKDDLNKLIEHLKNL